ncbi:hypothetical protein, partial [Salmonella enterica]|uniref:hypothetical protein n=1 Tax=Salmonella enterica TaxID=28901 RepID=UPI0020C232CF
HLPDLKFRRVVYTLRLGSSDQFAYGGQILFVSPPFVRVVSIKPFTINFAWCLALGLEERRGITLRFPMKKGIHPN